MNQNYSKLLLFISVLDIMENEIGSGHRLIQVFISVLDIMENEIGSGHRLIQVLQETIHFIFYCRLLMNFSLMNYWPF